MTNTVAIIGSGFGGAVSALRLAEQGWDVTVLEQGRRLTDDDLLRARKDLRVYLWGPGANGFFWQRVFRHMGIIGANAVGGGSIVWAAVLLEPKPAFFADPAWPQSAQEEDWHAHYETAARMLGRTTTPESVLGLQDTYLERTAHAMGAGDTFGRVPSAIYYGDGPGITKPDPFFDGDGPERTGCRLCGGCLTGCPYGAKNTLDRNYLHLAERAGARIVPQTRVDAIVPRTGGGYALTAQHGTTYTADRVVVSAGVLGTVELLARCRDELGTLPHVSPMLGQKVRTNSEAITGVLQPPGSPPLATGPSISTDFHPDPQTHITQNRYVGGGRILRLSLGPLTDGHDAAKRTRETLAHIVRHPLQQLRVVFAKDFEQRYTALSVMQSGDGVLALEYRRSPFRPWKRVLRSARTEGPSAPSYIEQANDATRAFARVSGGTPLNMTVESIAGRSFTAHILGGAVMGEDASTGVVDADHEVFGHPGLYVADASVIPADVGVNPSLTITAMSERFAERFGAPGRTRPLVATAPLPTTITKLAALWAALPAPDTIEGDWHASFVGPRTLRTVAPLGVARAGLPGWLGKRFDADGHGTNLVDHGRRTHLAMTATRTQSVIDRRDALVVSYAPDAPLPWRHVRDELRALPDGRLLGMSVIPSPGPLPSRGLPFLLTKAQSSATGTGSTTTATASR